MISVGPAFLKWAFACTKKLGPVSREKSSEKGRWARYELDDRRLMIFFSSYSVRAFTFQISSVIADLEDGLSQYPLDK